MAKKARKSAARRKREREERADAERLKQKRLGAGAPPVKQRAGVGLDLPGHVVLKGTRDDAGNELEPNASLETVLAPDGSRTTVASLGLSMRGLERQHVDAANRYASDYAIAGGGLKSPSFSPKVDGSHGHGAHMAVVDAQRSISELRNALGDRDYAILQAVVIYNATIEQLRKMGGPEQRIVSHEIRRILTRVAVFYSGRSGAEKAYGDALMRAAMRIISELEFGNEATANALLAKQIAAAK